jgi:hypothetical protein
MNTRHHQPDVSCRPPQSAYIGPPCSIRGQTLTEDACLIAPPTLCAHIFCMLVCMLSCSAFYSCPTVAQHRVPATAAPGVVQCPSPKQSTLANPHPLVTTATTEKQACHGAHCSTWLWLDAVSCSGCSCCSLLSCAPKSSTSSWNRLPCTHLNHLLRSTPQAAHSASAFHMLDATYDSQSLQPSGAVPRPASTIFSATRAVSTLLMARIDWKGGNSLHACVKQQEQGIVSTLHGSEEAALAAPKQAAAVDTSSLGTA